MKAAIAILLLMLCLGCSDATEATRVRLELSPTSDFAEGFEMLVSQTPSGAHCLATWRLRDDSRQTAQDLTQEELDALLGALAEAGSLTLEDGDCGDEESQVLYTRLDLKSGDYARHTEWRGLPPEQARLASVLLASPLGPTLSQGLGDVQRRKAELNTPQASTAAKGSSMSEAHVCRFPKRSGR